MKNPVFHLCDRIRETSFALHRHLRHGHLEKVYENGLAHRLRQQGLEVLQQHALNVLDEAEAQETLDLLRQVGALDEELGPAIPEVQRDEVR